MKKSILVAAFAALAMVAGAKIISERLAKPDEKEGFKIFMLCSPVDEYEKVGYVKVKVAWTGKPDEMLNSLLKKAKNDYPTGDAILITDVSMDEAMVVKFK